MATDAYTTLTYYAHTNLNLINMQLSTQDEYLASVISIGKSPVGSTSFAKSSLLISIILTYSSTP